MRKKQNIEKGFTLIETVIVLVIIGIIIAGVFLAVGAVSEERKISDIKRQVSSIINNTYDYYSGRGDDFTINDGYPDTDMNTFYNAGIFPSDLGCKVGFVSTPFWNIDVDCRNPYGGNYAMDMSSNADGSGNIPLQLFDILITKLSQKACVDTLISFSKEDRFFAACPGFNQCSTSKQNFSVDQAITYCQANNGNLTMFFDFKR